jgi:hypothetical protein
MDVLRQQQNPASSSWKDLCEQPIEHPVENPPEQPSGAHPQIAPERACRQLTRLAWRVRHNGTVFRTTRRCEVQANVMCQLLGSGAASAHEGAQ